jgi:hypothetical protein
MRAATASRSSSDDALSDAIEAASEALDVLLVLSMALGGHSGGLLPNERDAIHTLVAHATGRAQEARSCADRAQGLLRGSL